MSKLRLTIACHISDRTRALADGRISIEGADLNWLDLHVAEIFWRMCQNRSSTRPRCPSAPTRR